MTAKPIPRRSSPNHSGFTLVEILVVIAIIGILLGIAIPAINGALKTANQTAQKLELNSLAQAVEDYNLQYGDYPPDGSNAAVFSRHMRTLFPRMSAQDTTILARLVDASGANAPMPAAAFSGAAMDRAEALVFFLGGFSKNEQFPITGPDGPLTLLPTGTPGSTSLVDYGYNFTRGNSFFEFDPSRLMTVQLASGLVRSTDEVLLNNAASPTLNAAHGSNGTNGDLLPAYRAVSGIDAPIVYFDSRTYGVIGVVGGVNVYNGYLSFPTGGVRPYKTSVGAVPPSGTNYGTEAAAFAAVRFKDPDTFQIISPGSDGFFGRLVSVSTTSAAAVPVHMVVENGLPVQPLSTATSIAGLTFTDTSLGGGKFQDRDWGATYTDNPAINGHIDNVSNFSALVIEGELQEESSN